MDIADIKEVKLHINGSIDATGKRSRTRDTHLAEAVYYTDDNTLIIKTGSQCVNWRNESYKHRDAVIGLRAAAKNFMNKDGVFIADYTMDGGSHGTPLSPAYMLLSAANSSGDRWGYIDKYGISHNKGVIKYLMKLGIIAANNQFIPPAQRRNGQDTSAMESETNNENNFVKENDVSNNSAEANDDGDSMAVEGWQPGEKLKPYLGKNTIFYGVPGCGKSYKVKELLGADGEGSKVPEAQCKRVLFHPEYSYSDFVGQVMPQTEGERIEYKFAPGPFVEILKDAYDHPRKEYFLIIEEINRGNAPAIFGDLFQLLDRRPKKSGEEEGAKPGESEYGIYNRDILGVLNEGREEPLEEVKIPANLTLFATMNTCDQNVFTLDTAFKRRWRMQRIKNMFYADKEPFVCVIGQSGGKIGERGIIWKEFAEAVNKDILLNCNDGTAAEDKLLGAYFVNEEEIADAQVFAEKVLMYLREDVARYDKSQLFDAKYPTLDAVIDGFVRGENVFSPACGNIKALYDRVPDTATPSEEE